MTRWTEKDLDGFLARNAQHPCVSPARNVVAFALDKVFALGRLKTGEMNKTEAAYAAHLESKKPLKGIDRPENAPDDWRGSILEHIRLSTIDAQINEQAERNRLARNAPAQRAGDDDLSRPGDSKRYTPAQLKQVYVLRRYHRETRAG